MLQFYSSMATLQREVEEEQRSGDIFEAEKSTPLCINQTDEVEQNFGGEIKRLVLSELAEDKTLSLK